MKLPIPIIYNDVAYTDAEMKKLKNGTIADSSEAMKEKGDFAGMSVLVSGTLKNLSNDEGEILENGFDAAVKCAPIQAVEYLALYILTMEEDEGVDQIAICPRCGKQKIYEDDQAVKFEDLNVLYHDGEQVIHVDLDDPVEIKDKKNGGILLSVTSLDFRFPLVKDGIAGYSRIPSNKDVRRSYATMAEAIINVNGDPVEPKFTKSWGQWVIERMCRADLKDIQKILDSVGIEKSIVRECMECGKKWNESVNLSGFFVSGLRQ